MVRPKRVPPMCTASFEQGGYQQTEKVGSKYLSIECSTYVSEALIRSKDYTNARQRLELDLAQSEKLGLRMQTARIHYLLGTLLRLNGNAREAAPHYTITLRLLSDIQKGSGAEHIIDRPDLHDIYAESARWASQRDLSPMH